MVRTAIALLVLGASSATASAATTHRCADVHERGGQTATRVVASGISCKLARQGIDTYLGAPQGCITSSGCGQTGVGSYRHSLVDCARSGHRVSCTVIVPGRRGKVMFVMHPIGYPGYPGTKP